MGEEESLSQAAYRQLEEAIVTLKLKPGEAVTESRLTQDLKMGRTPIREAIQRLAWEGLVTIRPRLGILVADIKQRDAPDVTGSNLPVWFVSEKTDWTVGIRTLAVCPEENSQEAVRAPGGPQKRANRENIAKHSKK